MKICLITNLYKPHNRGGAEGVVLSTANGLYNHGQDVFIVTAEPFSGFKSFKPTVSIEEGIKIYRFYPLNLFFYKNDFKHNILLRFIWHIADMFNFHSYFVIKKIIKKERPDIVHTHNLKGLSFLIPRMIKKIGIKHVHTLHDLQLICPRGLMFRKNNKPCIHQPFICKLYKKFCKTLFASPDIIISPSKFLAEAYHNAYFFKKSHYEILKNPIPDFRYVYQDLRPVEFNSQEKNLVFLYVGQVEEHKGVLDLIVSFKQVLKNVGPALPVNPHDTHRLLLRLHIVGFGSAIKKAKNLAQSNEHIIFHDYVDHNDLPRFFKLSDILIAPSRVPENSPTVIYEALSFGLPVIASRIGGIPELIDNGHNGLTFEARNTMDLADTIRYAYNNRDRIKEMRLNAFKSVEKYRLPRYTESLMGLYESIARPVGE